jgi:hypothetical protein
MANRQIGKSREIGVFRGALLNISILINIQGVFEVEAFLVTGGTIHYS